MSQIQTVINDLKDIHDGDAWHGPSLKEILSGVTAERAAAKPLANAHSIWEITSHIAALADERLRETVPGKDYTVEQMLRGLVRHHVYHAGQIALLKKS